MVGWTGDTRSAIGRLVNIRPPAHTMSNSSTANGVFDQANIRVNVFEVISADVKLTLRVDCFAAVYLAAWHISQSGFGLLGVEMRHQEARTAQRMVAVQAVGLRYFETLGAHEKLMLERKSIDIFRSTARIPTMTTPSKLRPRR